MSLHGEQFEAAVLNLGFMHPLGGPWINFTGSLNLGMKKITTLFSLASKWNLAFHSIMNFGNKAIYASRLQKFSLTSVNLTT